MKNWEKNFKTYLEESALESRGQKECYENLRRYFIEKFGGKSVLVIATELLHSEFSPKTNPGNYKERQLKNERRISSLINLSLFELWNAAETANLANDENLKERRLFIPQCYFFDIKTFFLELMLIKIFDGKQSAISLKDKDTEIARIKKNGATLMICFQDNSLLLNLEKGDSKFFEELRRGLHLPLRDIDPKILSQLRKFINYKK